MQIFISGGSGQIGSRIAELLPSRGIQDFALDNSAIGKRVHLPASHDFLTSVKKTKADSCPMEFTSFDRMISAGVEYINDL